MALVPKHGVNGLIYVYGSEIDGANAWSLTITQESADYVKFGDSWVSRLAGVNDWSGSIGAVHDQDAKKLQTAATARAAVALLIYPDRSDLSTYYSGSAIFQFGSSADRGSVVAQTSDFVGSSTLALTGWAA